MRLFLASLVAAVSATSHAGAQGQAELTEYLRFGPPPPPVHLPDDVFWNTAFGGSLAVWDDWLWVGDFTAGRERGGEFYVYRRSVGGWAYTQRITPQPLAATAGVVAIDEGWAVVGDQLWDFFGSRTGKAFVYRSNPVGGQWEFAQDFRPEGLGDFYSFGSSVAISGNLLAVGAPGWPAPPGLGAVFLYERDAADSWRLVQRLELPDNADTQADRYTLFGRAVALQASTLAVGAGSREGAVLMYERQPSGLFRRTHILRDTNPQDDDTFGFTVALDGPLLVVGKPSADGGGSTVRPGRALIYERSGSDWLLRQEVRASDGFATPGGVSDRFGSAVDVEDGRVLVGAHTAREPGSSSNYTGAAYLFEADPSGVWPPLEDLRLSPADNSSGNALGFAVRLNGGEAVVGDRSASYAGLPSGAVHVYLPPLGSPFCQDPQAAELMASGSASVSAENLVLAVSGVRSTGPVLFLVGSAQAPALTHIPFSGERLCVSGQVHRMRPRVMPSREGRALLRVAFASPSLATIAAPGTTLYFQAVQPAPAGGTGRRLTNAVAVPLE